MKIRYPPSRRFSFGAEEARYFQTTKASHIIIQLASKVMSKWVTLQNHVVGQGSCSWTRCAAVHRISVRFASRKALRVSDEEVLGLLQEFQTVLEPTNADNATDDNVSKQWGEQGGMSFEDMPLSPLMHPNLINARKRYTDSKPLPSKDKTEFQKLLVKNPFGNTSLQLLFSFPLLTIA